MPPLSSLFMHTPPSSLLYVKSIIFYTYAILYYLLYLTSCKACKKYIYFTYIFNFFFS
nr:MAG TPA: hypothetical protein [Caudoviricetes sp.]